MPTPEELRFELWQQLLDAFSDEYEEANENWRAIEAKAQVTVTVGGVFLAAAFAFSRELTNATTEQRWLLIASILLLLAAVAYSVRALRFQRVSTPPLGNFVELGVADLTKFGDRLSEDHIARFTEDRVAQWREAIRSVVEANDTKAGLVRRAHALLGCAMLPIAVFTILRLLG